MLARVIIYLHGGKNFKTLDLSRLLVVKWMKIRKSDLMAYVEYNSHCDKCGKNHVYVKFYYDKDTNGELINTRMLCIDCRDAETMEWAHNNYENGGNEYLEYKERNKEEDRKIRAYIESENERCVKKEEKITEELLNILDKMEK